MKRDRIAINKTLIPYNFNILLAGEWFNIRVDYNSTADLFTLTLNKDEEEICHEPIVYGVPLFKDVFESEKYPAIEIIPWDESGKETKVTHENLNDTVFLVVNNGGDSIG